MAPEDRDGLHLMLIAEAIADLNRRLQDMSRETFLADADERALTAFRLSIIAENANKLSDELRRRYPDLPWKEMAAFRNIVSQTYHLVRPQRSWAAVGTLPAVLAMVRAELARLDSAQP